MVTFPSCKINLGLKILSRRSDGFHNIETILYPVPWTDILEIIPNQRTQATPDFRSTGIRLFGPKEKNLCIRAVQLLSEKYSIPPIKMHLHKVIPVGAGLGGGSSDAANTLVLLNDLFKIGIPEPELESLASQLGSDCPFFIRNRAVLASGKGDVFKPLSLRLKNYYIVIVKPRTHISTSEAYANVKPEKSSVSLETLIQKPVDEWKDCITNDFEKTVFEKYPGIRNLKTKMYKLGASYASMSGSGSSVYGLFKNEKNLRAYFRSCTVWQGSL